MKDLDWEPDIGFKIFNDTSRWSALNYERCPPHLDFHQTFPLIQTHSRNKDGLMPKRSEVLDQARMVEPGADDFLHLPRTTYHDQGFKNCCGEIGEFEARDLTCWRVTETTSTVLGDC
jgi:hypothetical protein